MFLDAYFLFSSKGRVGFANAKGNRYCKKMFNKTINNKNQTLSEKCFDNIYLSLFLFVTFIQKNIFSILTHFIFEVHREFEIILRTQRCQRYGTTMLDLH